MLYQLSYKISRSILSDILPFLGVQKYSLAPFIPKLFKLVINIASNTEINGISILKALVSWLPILK